MIKDSGNRTKFESGAVRDIQEGKGRCDLLPLSIIGAIYEKQTFDGSEVVLYRISDFQETGDARFLASAIRNFFDKSDFETLSDMWLEVAIHFEEGAKKYGERNWEKGIPVQRYIDSGVRHYFKWLRGDQDERHDRAFVWNMLCAIWTAVMKPELNEYAKSERA